MLKYQIVPVTAFEQNCSIIWCDKTKEAAIIDAGGDLPRILKKCEELKIKPTQILLTHGHIDHAGGAGQLSQELNIPIIGPHIGDDYWIKGLPEQSARYGFTPAKSFTPNKWLNDNDIIKIGESELQVLHTPGHTPGHVIFYSQELKHAFVGDVLFAGSIGRTDFPGGNYEQLISSIKDKLWRLDNKTTFTSGHGQESSFENERKYNPFVKD